jgi:putative flippase GtrA
MAAEEPVVAASGRLHPVQVVLCGTRTRLHDDGAIAQFARFVSVGVASTLVYLVLFLALRGAGTQPANLTAMVASSVLANELHRRVTFHAGGRVRWLTAQWEGGGLAALGLLATSAALAALDGLVGRSWWAQLLLVCAVTGTIGLARFLALRLWVFSGRARRREVRPG